ncbi:hypothetical protein E2C01_043803 [Portunus trituberculatus]|uniref:Uncharacterized protein n=1 Tax=Portunus trituberculatus TaxID=210409 RepID=A0A5B7FXC3_PORTR|nr:hypothetical protein [Portunus trituberculatus]
MHYSRVRDGQTTYHRRRFMTELCSVPSVAGERISRLNTHSDAPPTPRTPVTPRSSCFWGHDPPAQRHLPAARHSRPHAPLDPVPSLPSPSPPLTRPVLDHAEAVPDHSVVSSPTQTPYPTLLYPSWTTLSRFQPTQSCPHPLRHLSLLTYPSWTTQSPSQTNQPCLSLLKPPRSFP